MSVNKVILVGRLGKDPEVRETSSGDTVANFSLATDESFKDRSGEKQKRTEWHRLVIWGKLAGVARDYLHKGDLLYVEGKIQSREFQDSRDDTRKTVTEILVSSLNMLSTKRNDEPTTAAPVKAKATTRIVNDDEGDADVGF